MLLPMTDISNYVNYKKPFFFYFVIFDDEVVVESSAVGVTQDGVGPPVAAFVAVVQS
jgi:hypothetical protein